MGAPRFYLMRLLRRSTATAAPPSTMARIELGSGVAKMLSIPRDEAMGVPPVVGESPEAAVQEYVDDVMS